MDKKTEKHLGKALSIIGWDKESLNCADNKTALWEACDESYESDWTRLIADLMERIESQKKNPKGNHPKGRITVAYMREITHMLNNGEISYNRFIEMINEKANEN